MHCSIWPTRIHRPLRCFTTNSGVHIKRGFQSYTRACWPLSITQHTRFDNNSGNIYQTRHSNLHMVGEPQHCTREVWWLAIKEQGTRPRHSDSINEKSNTWGTSTLMPPPPPPTTTTILWWTQWMSGATYGVQIHHHHEEEEEEIGGHHVGGGKSRTFMRPSTLRSGSLDYWQRRLEGGMGRV